MESDELYPELREYIFSYCGRYFWPEQKLRIFVPETILNSEAANLAMYKILCKGGVVSDDPLITHLTDDGFEAYKARITTLIFQRYRKELRLNLCPKCDKVARTSYSKQCRFCFHDWHDK